MNIVINDRPVSVVPQCANRILVELDGNTRIEARRLESKIQATRAGIEAYRRRCGSATSQVSWPSVDGGG